MARAIGPVWQGNRPRLATLGLLFIDLLVSSMVLVVISNPRIEEGVVRRGPLTMRIWSPQGAGIVPWGLLSVRLEQG